MIRPDFAADALAAALAFLLATLPALGLVVCLEAFRRRKER
jgi:hypothetical protein